MKANTAEIIPVVITANWLNPVILKYYTKYIKFCRYSSTAKKTKLMFDKRIVRQLLCQQSYILVTQAAASDFFSATVE